MIAGSLTPEANPNSLGDRLQREITALKELAFLQSGRHMIHGYLQGPPRKEVAATRRHSVCFWLYLVSSVRKVQDERLLRYEFA